LKGGYQDGGKGGGLRRSWSSSTGFPGTLEEIRKTQTNMRGGGILKKETEGVRKMLFKKKQDM